LSRPSLRRVSGGGLSRRRLRRSAGSRKSSTGVGSGTRWGSRDGSMSCRTSVGSR